MSATRITWLLLSAALAALAPSGAQAAVNRHVETFSTTAYRDAAATTADWSTAAGLLRLPAFQPAMVGKFNVYAINSRAYSVAIAGDYAYLCDGPIGLKVLDISDPRAPAFVSGYPSINCSYGIALGADYAFIAGGAGGLQVLDVSNPLDPAAVATLPLGAYAIDVALAGHRVYVTAGGLRAISVSDPAAPVEVSSSTTPGRSGGLAVAGRYAYVAHDENGLLVYSIATAAGVQLIADLPLPGQAWDVAVAGNVAYVACAGGGLQVVDVSTPGVPALIGSYAPAGTVANGIAVDGDYAYLADGVVNGLRVLNVTTPSSPTLLWSVSLKNPQSAALAGAHLFVADEDSGLAVVEARKPSPLWLRGAYNTPGNAQNVCVDGDYAFVADQASGLRIVDIRNLSAPVSAGVCTVPGGGAIDVAVAGDYAYVATYSAGLQVIDVQVPAAPFVRAALAGPTGGEAIAVAGRYAYVACVNDGLQVVDIGNPASPVLVGSLDTGYWAYDVAVDWPLVFVAGVIPALAIVDVRNPAAPALVGSYPYGTSQYGVAVDGDRVYLAGGSEGLKCIDVTNPAAPVLLGTHATPGEAMAVAASGDFAFVADLNNGVHAFDVSDPAHPVLLGSYALPPSVYGLTLDGDHVFAAAGYTSGLQVLRAFQRSLDVDRNRGQSLDLASRQENIGRARLATVQYDSVGWQLSADGGATWQDAIPGGDWLTFWQPGNDLRWRSAHFPGPWLVNPYCDEVTVEWLYDFPVIEAVADVPDDQGGWVRVRTTRSGRDFASETSSPITAYYLWHRVDDKALARQVAPAPPPPDAAGAPPGIEVVSLDGRLFHLADAQKSGLPPGTWEVAGSFPAIQQDAYIHLTPTTGDSTAAGAVPSVYVVTAHTAAPTVWFASPPDSGCSVDNIAPGVPGGFAVAYGATGNALAWAPAPEPDFQFFRVYRGDAPGFVPGPENLVHATAGTDWVDAAAEPWSHHYQVTAVDHAGNESAPAAPGAVSGVGDGGAPARFALHAAAPNPFNPATTLVFDLPAPSPVRLAVHDAAGRVVRRLLAQALPAGRHSVRWDGRDERGRLLASGAYFCRLEAGAWRSTGRLTLVR